MPLHTSDNLDELATALAKAQAEMQPVIKAKKANMGANSKYSYSYADLAAVIESATATLAGHGLSIATPFEVDDRGDMVLVMVLLHTSGQRIVSRYPVRAASDSPQAVGSAISYARRYAMMSIINLPAADDDGQAAMMPQGQRQPQWTRSKFPKAYAGHAACRREAGGAPQEFSRRRSQPKRASCTKT